MTNFVEEDGEADADREDAVEHDQERRGRKVLVVGPIRVLLHDRCVQRAQGEVSMGCPELQGQSVSQGPGAHLPAGRHTSSRSRSGPHHAGSGTCSWPPRSRASWRVVLAEGRSSRRGRGGGGARGRDRLGEARGGREVPVEELRGSGDEGLAVWQKAVFVDVAGARKSEREAKERRTPRACVGRTSNFLRTAAAAAAGRLARGGRALRTPLRPRARGACAFHRAHRASPFRRPSTTPAKRHQPTRAAVNWTVPRYIA